MRESKCSPRIPEHSKIVDQKIQAKEPAPASLETSWEEAARETLLCLLMGTPASIKPELKPFLVSLACSDSPPRSPRGGQSNTQSALGSSLVDRVAVILSLPNLDEVDLLDIVEALHGESQELPALFILRSLFSHPACTARVKIRLVLKFARRPTSKINPVGWTLISEQAGPYARAAALLGVQVSNSNDSWRERLAFEIGMLPQGTFELLSTLIADRTSELAGNQLPSLGEVSEMLLSARDRKSVV